MQSFIVYLLVSTAILFASALVVYLWEKFFPSVEDEPHKKNPVPEGAFRALYHLLWVLLLWSGLALSTPLWISFHQQLSSTSGLPRWILVLKVAVLPLIFLLVLRYGKSKKYIGWIESLEWPDEENK